jgi:SM-20-related protein
MSAAPAPHLTIDGFLGEARMRELVEWALAKQDEFHEAGFYTSAQGAHVDKSVRDCRHLLDLGPLRAAFAASVDAILARATRELGTGPLAEAKKEMEMVWNGDGGFFKRHADARRRPDGHDSVRALTLVYYFHLLPKRFDGGELRLYSPLPDAGFVDIAPLRDRLVAFPSFFVHEVLPTRCATAHFADGRFSINCWIRRPRATAE